MKAETDTLFDESEYKQHELNLSFVKMGALEDEYKQNGPCLLYSPLTSFGKEACSIVRNMPISRTDVTSSQYTPLIEYSKPGVYVIVSSQEGELHLEPDSPAWFDWLAALSSFRFDGKQGRFTAYREAKHHVPTRSWSAHRSIHQHRYKHCLGVTDRLTIAFLEQMAAKLQAYVDAL